MVEKPGCSLVSTWQQVVNLLEEYLVLYQVAF